jgi:hypothetical protein
VGGFLPGLFLGSIQSVPLDLFSGCGQQGLWLRQWLLQQLLQVEELAARKWPVASPRSVGFFWGDRVDPFLLQLFHKPVDGVATVSHKRLCTFTNFGSFWNGP